MKRDEWLRFLWLIAVVLLAGCLPLSRETTVDPAPPLPTLVLQPATAMATPATVLPTAVADVGGTAVPPTHTPTVVADVRETAVPLPPALTTQGAINVR
ncbi:MAG: hypothetical protein KC425_04930, partial [Anaerolineales bacterium]|nr:hypothetical protein [Anaerolineales bacterium]